MKARFLLSGGNSNVEVEVADPDQVISSIKKQIASEINVGWEEQKWVYKGKVLTNEDTLSSVGFTDGDAIHVLKSAKAAPVPSPPSQFIPVPHFDAAMRSLLSKNSNEAAIKMCLTTISKVVNNIINKPFEEKYRKLKATNSSVQQKILSCQGSTEILTALGFLLMGEEYIIQSNSMAWVNLISCNAKLQVFLNKLEQIPVPTSSSSAAPAPPAPPPVENSVSAPAPVTVEGASSAPQSDEDMQKAMQQFAMSLLAMSGSIAPTPGQGAQTGDSEGEGDCKESSHNDSA